MALFYWPKPGHRGHADPGEPVDASLARRMQQHTDKTGCSCDAVCVHSGWLWDTAYCDGCGKAIS